MSKKYLLRSSAILTSTQGIAALFMSLFLLYMARALGPADYSVFGLLLSIFFIFYIAASMIETVLMKFIPHFKAKSQYGKISSLFYLSLRVLFLIGLIVFILTLVFSRYLADVFSISPVLFIILGLWIWAYLLSSVIFGFLTGLKKFIIFGIDQILNSVSALILGIILVLLNFGVGGAVLALFLSNLVVIFPGLKQLGFLFRIKRVRIGKVGLLKYIVPAAIASVAIAIMLNVDVILVKYFFSVIKAGHYAAAALLGKSIFFISTSFIFAMFPKVSELHSDGKQTLPFFKHTFFYTLAISTGIVFLYLLIPDFISGLLFGSEYKISNIIGIFAMAVTFLALSNIIVMYNLAIRKYNFSYVLLAFSILEFILVMLFHKSLLQVVVVLLIVMFTLFAVLVCLDRENLFVFLKKKKIT